MYFAVISIMPDMFVGITNFGITGRAIAKRQVVCELINPRDFTHDNYRRIDERPFGGGAGMVMMAEPLSQAIEYAKCQAVKHNCQHCPVVYLSPQGTTLSEKVVQDCLKFDGMILLCGRYDGIDERIIEAYVDMEMSIGDYVLTGGELPAMVLMDSVIRRLPNVMQDNQSAVADSFVDGLLDYPQYTKPIDFKNKKVPDVLLSGHHRNIAKWRFLAQAKRTMTKRPDLWQDFIPTKEQANWLQDLEN